MGERKRTQRNGGGEMTLACTNCGVAAPTSQQQGNFIDYGWSLGNCSLGHYGGFSDNFPCDEEEAHLCHDCCLKMLEALPGLAKHLFPNGGGHPNMNGSGIEVPSCCEYAWTWGDKCEKNCGNSDTYFGAPNGAWRKQECLRCKVKQISE